MSTASATVDKAFAGQVLSFTARGWWCVLDILCQKHLWVETSLEHVKEVDKGGSVLSLCLALSPATQEFYTFDKHKALCRYYMVNCHCTTHPHWYLVPTSEMPQLVNCCISLQSPVHELVITSMSLPSSGRVTITPEHKLLVQKSRYAVEKNSSNWKNNLFRYLFDFLFIYKYTQNEQCSVSLSTVLYCRCPCCSSSGEFF